MGGFAGGGFMGILWIVIAAVLVVGIYRLVKPGSPAPRARDESPEEILKQRYARGEIGKDLYEKTLADLRR
jgi:putative membrane protein